MKAILVNEDKPLRWDDVPNPILGREDCLVKIEAAAMPEAFATAYLNLFIVGGAKVGDTLLITGGNSGLARVTIPCGCL